jgi:5-methylcytosine-specific restriction protein B
MNFQEFCKAQTAGEQEIVCKASGIVNFGKPGGTTHTIETEAMFRFLEFLSSNQERCKAAVQNHSLFDSSKKFSNYDEKPYRALYSILKREDNLNTIVTLAGSQTKGLTEVISKLISFSASMPFLGVKENTYFDKDVVDKALLRLMNETEFLYAEQISIETANRKAEFERWMKSNGVADTTILKYARTSINKADELVLRNRIGDKSLYEIDSVLHIVEVVDELTKLPEWAELNKVGNNMYGAGVSKYVEFLRFTSGQDYPPTPFSIEEFRNCLNDARLSFSEHLIERFVSSLCSKPFLILTGLSGSGKTKLAQSFAQWICSDEKQYSIVPVGADWTNREPLLGFQNALNREEYVKPESRALDLLLTASENPTKPFFLILDEMNLSHVERYFADFLSAMESKEAIPLHSESDQRPSGVPEEIILPKNLYIIGTVNIDETTYMFSPKVLDRANVIEFRVTDTEMGEFLNSPTNVDMDRLCGLGGGMAADFVSRSKLVEAVFEGSDAVQNVLQEFFVPLQKVGAEFGYRSASEIMQFAAKMRDISEKDSEIDNIIDAAVVQKLLPKLHGSRKRLEPVLAELKKLCGPGSPGRFPISYDKLERMEKRVQNDGFTSFAEA